MSWELARIHLEHLKGVKFTISEDHRRTSRGYMPHLDEPGLIQSITFRLADSLPQRLIKQAEEELKYTAPANLNHERRKKLEEYLDSGIGCCCLRESAVAQVVEDALLHHDGNMYDLLEWCIMPNHVHALICQRSSLGKIVKSWKSFTGREAKQNYKGKMPQGERFWYREYWDRIIRNEKHLAQTISYIRNNPVKAELCDSAEEWDWSSASSKWDD